MIDKQKILFIVRDIMFQIREILYKEYNTQELRNKNNITVFSKNCPVCVEYLKDTEHEFANHTFPYKGCRQCFLFDCHKLETKPTDKFDDKQLKVRLTFWIKVLNYVESLSGNESLEDVRHDIYQIDIITKHNIKLDEIVINKASKHSAIYNELFIKI